MPIRHDPSSAARGRTRGPLRGGADPAVHDGATRGIVVLLAAGLLVGGNPGAQPAEGQDADGVEVVATHVAGTVYALQGRGGNIGVSLGEDGVLLVDDQFEPLAGQIRAAVDSLGGGGVDFVLNTHWHHDHTDGNKAFGREAPILSHHNVRARLATPQAVRGDTTSALPGRALPEVTFGEGLSVHLNGEEIRVKHMPSGHTDGDAVVFFTESDVVHMGDHMFAGQFPFVDLETGGSVQGYVRNVAAVLDTIPDDALVIPGHGPLTDVEGLREYHRMLERTTAIVRERMDRGLGLEEVQAEGLPERWASWGEGFISTEQWLETVYRSLADAGETASAGSDGSAGWHPHGHDGRAPGAHRPGGDGPRGGHADDHHGHADDDHGHGGHVHGRHGGQAGDGRDHADHERGTHPRR